jgi:negative regulator of sigma-B (phosphoserine phosphatase)
MEWAAAGRARPGERVCGDHPIVVEVGDNAALFGVLDGLGHGEAAATAALRAVEVLRGARAEPLDVLAELCHRALAATRGAAMTLARIDFDSGTLGWIGVGNVTANLVAKSPSGVEIRSSLPLARGIVGYRIPETLVTREVSIRSGDLLVIASDGITENHLDDIDFATSAAAIGEQILGKHVREDDDAMVVVARHRGSS